MHIQRFAISALFAAGLAALPLSAAKAQYYSSPLPYPCNIGPLALPFCVASTAVSAALAIVAMPFRVVAGAPLFYEYPFFDAPYPAPPVAYYPAGANGSPYAFYDAR